MPSVRVQFPVHNQTILRSVRDVILTRIGHALIFVFLRAVVSSEFARPYGVRNPKTIG